MGAIRGRAGRKCPGWAGPQHRIFLNVWFLSLNGPSGAKVGVMEIVGSRGDAIVMKNRVTRITLGIVTARAFPTFEHRAQTLKTHWDIRSVPTIDGAQPHGWLYTVDMLLARSMQEQSTSSRRKL